MNTRQKKADEAAAGSSSPAGLNSLSEEDQARVRQLAILAETTPEEMLFFVLRDGFAACEASIRAGIQADADFAAGKGMPHADVMESIRSMFNAHAKRPRKAG